MLHFVAQLPEYPETAQTLEDKPVFSCFGGTSVQTLHLKKGFGLDKWVNSKKGLVISAPLSIGLRNPGPKTQT